MKIFIWDASNYGAFGDFYADGILIVAAKDLASAWQKIKDDQPELYYDMQYYKNYDDTYYVEKAKQIETDRNEFDGIIVDIAMAEGIIDIERAEKDKQLGKGWTDPYYPRHMSLRDYLIKMQYKYVPLEALQRFRRELIDDSIKSHDGISSSTAPQPKVIDLDIVGTYLFF